MSIKILLACDKFKGSISAIEVCNAVRSGMKRHYPHAEYLSHPMADGGDGSLAILKEHLGSELTTIDTIDPLSRNIKASYLIHEDSAYIELAEASGIALLKEAEKNVMITSTHGTGRLILDAITKGVQHVVLLLGGSCTNDAGLGIAHALGFKFYDATDSEINPKGQDLIKIKRIEKPKKDLGVSFELYCDVTNPFYGPHGAAYIYGRQKGANDVQIDLLDKGLQNIHNIIKTTYQIDLQNVPGSGSAGGIGGGLHALLSAKISKGFDQLSKLTQLEEKIKNADIIITGEGRLDLQSLDGKVIGKMAHLCRHYNKKLIAVVGMNELTIEVLKAQNIEQVLAVMDYAKNAEDAMYNAKSYLESMGEKIVL